MKPIILYRAVDFDFDPEELGAMQRHFNCVANRTLIEPGSLVIGRYSVLPYYRELEKDIEIIGSKMINSYRQHRYIADLQNWYGDLEEFTPKTWFRASDVPMTEPGAFVLKGATNSRKFLWKTHMFAPDRATVGMVQSKLLNDTMISMQDIYVRRYVPLKTFMIGLQDMPITEEYRFFICDGQILSGAYYWSSHVGDLEEQGLPVPDVKDVPNDFLQAVIEKVGDNARFWVLDVARTEEGDWIVVELNDGQMSGLSENVPETLYMKLSQVLSP